MNDNAAVEDGAYLSMGVQLPLTLDVDTLAYLCDLPPSPHVALTGVILGPMAMTPTASISIFMLSTNGRGPGGSAIVRGQRYGRRTMRKRKACGGWRRRRLTGSVGQEVAPWRAGSPGVVIAYKQGT